VVLAAPQLKPPAIVVGVAFDYSNYDARPPSVALVDPFSGEPYKAQELPTNLLRQVAGAPPFPPDLQMPDGMMPAQVVTHQPLMQAHGPEDIPFLCIAGVREYHEHPGHSGDAWELHRQSGAGRLVRLLDVIDKYGVAPLNNYNVTMVPQVAGFQQSEVPA
jgi:hypothetical protein